MINILVSIKNGLMSEAVFRFLKDTGTFLPFKVPVGSDQELLEDCRALSAHIALLGVSYVMGETAEERLSEARLLRQMLPECKIVFLCDENSVSLTAGLIANAKKCGLIDDFYYSSVTGNYLAISLTAL